MNRRRALQLLGLSTAFTACSREPELQTYNSVAFGTEVHFQTHSIPESLFQQVSQATTTRLAEIDSLFSLYNPDSAICQLNRDGFLETPAAEFVRLLRSAITFGQRTKGLFDITVQPLWDFRQQWKEASLPDRAQLEKAPWEQAIALVDYRRMTVADDRISFAKPGMAVTLNAIAQGHATDEVRNVLKQAGVENALVNIGEYAVLGTAPNGQPWPIQIRTESRTKIPESLETDQALAVSAGYGHTFDPEGRYHHIFRPANGANPKPQSTIIVTAPNATEADALATTLAVAEKTEREVI
ncbi:MAG: FAD:protein FMN transferase, partial [Verrucomicrobiales bacterium]